MQAGFISTPVCGFSRHWIVGAIPSGASADRLLFPQRVGDAVFLQLAVESGLADAQQLRGLELVAVEGANSPQNGLSLEIGQGGYLRGTALLGWLAGDRGGAPSLKTLLLKLRRQVAEMQHRTGGEGAGPLYRVFEFAHIARPVMAHHGA